MKNLILFSLAGVILLSVSCDRSKVDYPETKKKPVVDNYFGNEVTDPYRWLEENNSEEVANWVEAQNEVTFEYLSRIPYREDIRKRLSKLWDYTNISSPFMKSDKIFFYKREGLQNQSVLYVQDSFDDEPRILINPNNFSDDGTVALAGIGISKDAKYIAYEVADGGSDWRKIKVREIATGKDLDDEVKWVKFSSIQWYKNGFFYSRYDVPEEEGGELSNINEFHKVYYHQLGTSQSDDKLIFHSNEYPLRNYTAQVTSDEKFLIER